MHDALKSRRGWWMLAGRSLFMLAVSKKFSPLACSTYKL
jgi:hypothetical protein